jgi:hypothetical protein
MHIDEQIQLARSLLKDISTQMKQSGKTINRSDIHLLIRSLIPCNSKEEVITLIEQWSENIDTKKTVFAQGSVDKQKYLSLISTINNKIIRKYDLQDGKEIIGLMSRII